MIKVVSGYGKTLKVYEVGAEGKKMSKNCVTSFIVDAKDEIERRREGEREKGIDMIY